MVFKKKRREKQTKNSTKTLMLLEAVARRLEYFVDSVILNAVDGKRLQRSALKGFLEKISIFDQVF